MPTKKLESKHAFTLAETLITLVIIGVVAALTIPNLIINHQKEETITKLKKTYSTLAQITHKAIADHGPILSWDIDNNSENFFNTYMAPYLNISKVCGYTNQSNCNLKYSYRSSPNTFHTVLS